MFFRSWVIVSAAHAKSSRELITALHTDDECRGESEHRACALGLRQLRASKTGRVAETDGDGAVDDVMVDYMHPPWLSSCSQIYLDVGANVGGNVRKLFEPNKYPNSKFLPAFKTYFGPPEQRQMQHLCALGFEPNPQHLQQLHQLEQSYFSRGWHVHFYPLAAWRSDGFMSLNMTSKRGFVASDTTHEGAHLAMKSSEWPGARDTSVRTVDLAAFIKSLPVPVQFLTMDIEGAEYETLAQMMQKNVLCDSSVKGVSVEAHEWGEITHWGDASTFDEKIHPRSFKALVKRVEQLESFDWCKPGKVTNVMEIVDDGYIGDIDEKSGDGVSNKLSTLSVASHEAEVMGDPSVAQGYAHPGWLSNCKHIYVDFGSNIGVNVRKLFEPHKYEGANLVKEFDAGFGSAEMRRAAASTSGLCALGVEPNPQHFPRLQELQKAYRKNGWNVHFYPFAAWRSEGFMYLNVSGFRAPGPDDNTFEGAHLQMHFFAWPGAKDLSVRTVDAAAFIKSLPVSVQLLSMDIEGSEYEVLARLMETNTLCANSVKRTVIDAHAWGELTHWGDWSSFDDGVHPRSFKAIKQRIAQLSDYKWCSPADVSDVGQVNDVSYAQDVDDDFGKNRVGGISQLELAAKIVPAVHADLETTVDYQHPTWLKRCEKIYLDLGSNIGVNIRKLFEPEKYNGAALLYNFQEAFGKQEEWKQRLKEGKLCALGFEPNPKHFARLQALEMAYAQNDWNVHFYHFAAWKSAGFMSLNLTSNRIPGPMDVTDEGAHLAMRSTTWPGAKELSVQAVDIAAFVRSLPVSVQLMTIDVEGAEYEVLAQMMQKNILCEDVVKNAVVEAHEWGEITTWGDVTSFVEGIRPRSFKAIQQRMQQLQSVKWCDRNKVTTIVASGNNDFAENVDNNFSNENGLSTLAIATHGADTKEHPGSVYDHPTWIDSCSSIYLDVGSNIGVNTRKFFESAKYTNSTLSKIFDSLFGPVEMRRSVNDSGACVLGLEPNPQHLSRLQQIETKYISLGRKIHFYPYAAWRGDGFMALNTTGNRIPSQDDVTSEGAHLSMRSSQWPGSTEISVRTVDMAAFVRSLPAPVTLLTMDIEGSEYEVLTNLMQKNVMCDNVIKNAVLEAHEWGEITHWGDAASFLGSVHPRSFQAVRQRLDQLAGADWCNPASITNVSEFNEEMYSNDVDDNFE